MDDGMRFCRADGVVFEEMAGEAVLIQMETGNYFALNRVGTEFWGMLDGKMTLEEQAKFIADKYKVELERVWVDLEALADQLLRRSLISAV